MKTTMIAAAAAATTLTLAPMQASALVIDDFTIAQQVVDVPTAGFQSASQVSGLGILGGYRDMRVERISGNAPPEFDAVLSASGGTLGFSNTFGTLSRAWIVYDGDNDFSSTGIVNTSGLGGVNFLIGPSPFLDFNIITADAGLFVRISIWDMDGSKMEYTEDLPAFDVDPLLPLTDFNLVDGLEFDWARVGAIEFFVEATVTAYDGQIGPITLNAIPLPAPALLLLGGLGGLGGMTVLRNRRRKA